MRKISMLLATAAVMASTVVGTMPAQAAPGDLAIGLLTADVWILTPTVAVEVQNVTVEGLPGAQLIGTVSNFRSTNSAYSCLTGSTLNVWTAPFFGNHYVIHNGWQGPQCTYGTWVIEVPPRV